MERLFDDSSRVKSTQWFKFEKVGDEVYGVVLSCLDVPARGKFPAQLVFLVRTPEGVEYNVALKKTQYNIDTTRTVEAGDLLRVKFGKEIPNVNPRLSPTKALEIYHVKA